MHEIRKHFILPNHKPKEEELLWNWHVQQAALFIELMSLSRATRKLPITGGLLDQDSLFVFLYQHALKCQQERDELDERRHQRATQFS